VRTWPRAAQYLASFYWAMTTMTTVGYGDITPESDAERVLAVTAMVVGGAFYGFVIASMASFVTQTDENARACVVVLRRGVGFLARAPRVFFPCSPDRAGCSRPPARAGWFLTRPTARVGFSPSQVCVWRPQR
jgi:hypothetical protein